MFLFESISFLITVPLLIMTIGFLDGNVIRLRPVSTFQRSDNDNPTATNLAGHKDGRHRLAPRSPSGGSSIRFTLKRSKRQEDDYNKNIQDLPSKTAEELKQDILLKIEGLKQDKQQAEALASLKTDFLKNIGKVGYVYGGLYSTHGDSRRKQDDWDKQKIDPFLYENIKPKMDRLEAAQLEKPLPLPTEHTTAADDLSNQNFTELVFLFAGLVFIVNGLICLYIKKQNTASRAQQLITMSQLLRSANMKVKVPRREMEKYQKRKKKKKHKDIQPELVDKPDNAN